MRNCLIICSAEVKKAHRNYFKSISNYFSLLLWPILSFFTTYYTYSSFDNYFDPDLANKTNFFTFLILGCLGHNCFWAMVQGGVMQIREERRNGALEIIYFSPANRLALLYGRALGDFIQNTWMFFIFSSIIVMLISKFTYIILFKIIGSFMVLLLTSTIWGGLINSICIATRDAGFLFTIGEPMNFFSAVKFPLKNLPFWARAISPIFPSTYCIYIIRAIFMGNSVNTIKILELLTCLSIIVAITYILTKITEIHNRKTGNLQFY
ncbi:MAG: ABC transporter permease [Oscillospiraceae bacterium]|nr:ABC transporter permease [Oscillospiraceae bacterium]